MATLTPPQTAPKWTHTPEDVIRLTKDALAEYSATEDSVAALAPAECNFESVRHAPFSCHGIVTDMGFRRRQVFVSCSARQYGLFLIAVAASTRPRESEPFLRD